MNLWFFWEASQHFIVQSFHKILFIVLPVSETISGNKVCERSSLSAKNWLTFVFRNAQVKGWKIKLFVIYWNRWYIFEVFDCGLIAINDLSYEEKCIQKVLNKASRDNLRKSMMFSCRGVTNAWRFFYQCQYTNQGYPSSSSLLSANPFCVILIVYIVYPIIFGLP